jgi:hypothetical protein
LLIFFLPFQLFSHGLPWIFFGFLSAMATLKQVVSDSESDKPTDKKKSSVVKASAKGGKEPAEPMDVDGDEDDGKKDGPPASDAASGEEDEEEYEIEAIIAAKRGAFPGV